MAEVKDKPQGLKTSNALDDIPDTVSNHEIRLGQNVLFATDEPPAIGDFIDVALRLRIKHVGVDQNAPDSPLVGVRQAAIVVAWPLGEEMPEPKKSKAQLDAEAEAEAAKNQPPLYDDEGVDENGDDGE